MNLALAFGVLDHVALLGAELFNIQMPDWMAAALKDSPSLIFGLIVFWFAFKVVERSHKAHIASLVAEKDRVVKERDKLQSIILKNRLSTEETEKKPDAKKGRPK